MIARRHANQWYVAGVNAGKEPLKLKLDLSMLAGKKVRLYNDDASKVAYTKEININKTGATEIEIQPSGGFVLK